eukprot:1161787-Pelagomonas_calceolata.AAC.4
MDAICAAGRDQQAEQSNHLAEGTVLQAHCHDSRSCKSTKSPAHAPRVNNQGVPHPPCYQNSSQQCREHKALCSHSSTDPAANGSYAHTSSTAATPSSAESTKPCAAASALAPLPSKLFLKASVSSSASTTACLYSWLEVLADACLCARGRQQRGAIELAVIGSREVTLCTRQAAERQQGGEIELDVIGSREVKLCSRGRPHGGEIELAVIGSKEVKLCTPQAAGRQCCGLFEKGEGGLLLRGSWLVVRASAALSGTQQPAER